MSPLARRYLAPFLILTLGAAAGLSLRQTQPTAAPPPIHLEGMPLNFGDFVGRQVPSDSSVFAYLGADEMIDRVYLSEKDRLAVTLSLVFARGWRALHSPHDCFKNQGWRPIAVEDLDLRAAGAPGVVHATRLVMIREQTRINVVYTFTTRSATTGSWLRHSFRMALGQGKSGGALVVAVAASPDQSHDPAATQAASAVLLEAEKYLRKSWEASRNS